MNKFLQISLILLFLLVNVNLVFSQTNIRSYKKTYSLDFSKDYSIRELDLKDTNSLFLSLVKSQCNDSLTKVQSAKRIVLDKHNDPKGNISIELYHFNSKTELMINKKVFKELKSNKNIGSICEGMDKLLHRTIWIFFNQDIVVLDFNKNYKYQTTLDQYLKQLNKQYFTVEKIEFDY